MQGLSGSKSPPGADSLIHIYVDAQPLVVKALTINRKTQDVVCVATEANNIYAISASSGPDITGDAAAGQVFQHPLGSGWRLLHDGFVE